MRPIYLDHHATTPADKRVVDAMLPFLNEKFGNASSSNHVHGTEAKNAVEQGRQRIADLIGARSKEIIFTSGATEADNMALIGLIDPKEISSSHIISSAIEHKAVLNTLKYMRKLGAEITLLPVDEHGFVNIDELQEHIQENTKLISVILANNEVGTIQDFKAISEIAQDNDIRFHTDAAQALGRIDIDVRETPISMMSLSAHKIYGPKGIGALFINQDRPRVKLHPILFGGGQEKNLRAGTLNVPGIVGFGEATRLMKMEYSKNHEKMIQYRNLFLKGLKNQKYIINGPEERLAHNLNLWFPNVEAQALIKLISKYVSLSTGSACTTDVVEPSHVLMAMFNDEKRAYESIRIGFGKDNTKEDIIQAAEVVRQGLEHLRNIFT